MKQHHNAFEYTYSAPEQEEVRRIREKYLPKEEDKMEQLRRLDRSAAAKGTRASIILGTVSCLLLGVGMCCCMVWQGALFVPGILIGTAGIAGCALAYPVYARITEKERRRIAPKILRLTEELLK